MELGLLQSYSHFSINFIFLCFVCCIRGTVTQKEDLILKKRTLEDSSLTSDKLQSNFCHRMWILSRITYDEIPFRMDLFRPGWTE